MTSIEHIRRKVLELITKYEADKTDSLPLLMKKWKGKENDLLKTLCQKYNEKYTKMPPYQIKMLYSIGYRFCGYSYGSPRKCKRREDGMVFRLKVINKKQFTKSNLLKLESEINILREISHLNIIKLYDVFDSRSKMCLILDLIEGGQLFDRIIQKQEFSEKDAIIIFGEICDALQYLHKKSIVHNNLKPQNILFETKATDSKIKIVDFHLSDTCKNGNLCRATTYNDYYVSPEILETSLYDTQSDMWSIGVILYIILCGFPPFFKELSTRYDEYITFGFIRESQTNSFYIIPSSIIFLCLEFVGDCCNQCWLIKRRLYKKIKNGEYCMPSPYWDNISNNAKDLIFKLLESDPKKRLTAADALQHKWLNDKASDKAFGCYHQFHLKRFQCIQRLRNGVKCIMAMFRLIDALQC